MVTIDAKHIQKLGSATQLRLRRTRDHNQHTMSSVPNTAVMPVDPGLPEVDACE